jgi:hypothetical protein
MNDTKTEKERKVWGYVKYEGEEETRRRVQINISL